MMAVLIGFVALALDSARAFDARRIMQDAVDNAALGAAEYYQNNPSGWSGAETTAVNLFAEDNRVYTSHSCTPGSVTPTPGAPGTSVSMTCSFGTSSYQLTIAAEDDGPGGQSFALVGQDTLNVALIQVLGQSSGITVKAAGAATASDQSRTPALAGLSSSGCFGVTGTVPINVGTSINPVTIVGDVVADGTFNVSTSSYPRIAGNVLTRCAAPTNGSTNITYYCWPSASPASAGATATPCTSPAVPGRLLSTGNRFVDPGYTAPPAPATTVGFSSTNVVLSPGIYTTDPNFGNSSSDVCYFLPGGVYEWQAGYTVKAGLISNELKPPDEPVSTDNTTRQLHQFWRDNGATCDGSFSLSSGSFTGKGIGNGTWQVVVTSVRTAVYNGVNYTRESAPSMCRPLAVSGTDKTMVVTVSNVPGATSYNVYAAPPPSPSGSASCAGPFGLVGSVTNSSTETTSILSGCPNTAGGFTCSLGATAPTTFDSDQLPSGWAPDVNAAPDAPKSYPPDGETAAFNGSGSLPNSNAARAASPHGDRANENQCATSTGTVATCPAAVTPGAVAMWVTSPNCFAVNNSSPGSNPPTAVGGDAYLFGGYQYDWILNYEPAADTCASNNWYGVVNTAAIGMTYTPGASMNIAGAAGYSSYTGGIIANTILVQSASNLLIDFNKNFAPLPGGTRLTG